MKNIKLFKDLMIVLLLLVLILGFDLLLKPTESTLKLIATISAIFFFSLVIFGLYLWHVKFRPSSGKK